MTVFQLGFDPSEFAPHFDKINRDDFMGFAPGTVMFTDVSASGVTEAGILYDRVTFFFEMDRRTYRLSLLNAGFYELDSSNLVPLKDSEDNRRVTPGLLAADGSALSEGADPVFLDFDIHEAVKFGPLFPF